MSVMVLISIIFNIANNIDTHINIVHPIMGMFSDTIMLIVRLYFHRWQKINKWNMNYHPVAMPQNLSL